MPEPFQPWADTSSLGDQLDLMSQFLQLSQGRQMGIYCVFKDEHEAMALELAASQGLSVVADPHSLAYLISPDSDTCHRFLQSLHRASIPCQSQFKTGLRKVGKKVTRAASELLVKPWRDVTKAILSSVRPTAACAIRYLISMFSRVHKAIHFVLMFLILVALRTAVRVLYILLILGRFLCDLFILFIYILFWVSLIGLLAFNLLVLLKLYLHI
jgi:hypothetical protein